MTRTRLENNAADRLAGFPFGLAVVAVYVFFASLFGALLLRDLQQIDANVSSFARERGAALFSLVELARDWNAQHGGVYAQVTEQTQPNPYLKHPRRDVTTSDGVALTMINPAFMTRQMAEIAARKEGVQLHITSLNPIRPTNAADPWEAEALKTFALGAKEHLDLIRDSAMPVFRYMAPLFVKEPCLKCHAVQGYKLGEIRGGISVTMAAKDLLELAKEQKRSVLWRYGGVLLLVVTLTHLLLLGARRFVRAIQKINQEQETLISDRTRDLAEANTGLAHEVEQHGLHQRQLEESESRYRAVVEHGTDGVFIADSVGVLFANHRLAQMLGHPLDRLMGSDPVSFVHQQDMDRVSRWLDARRMGEHTVNPLRVRLTHGKSGQTIFVDLFITTLEATQEGYPRVLGTVRDVSAELDAEREAQIAAAVFDSAAEAILVTDAKANILQVNPAFTAITGYTPHEVVGKTPSLLRSGRHDAAFFEQMWDSLATRGRWQGEIWNRRKNGETYIEWLSITRIIGGEEHGGYVGTFTDITQRKEAEELMRHKAHHDALTDLPNRVLYLDRLHGALATARRHERHMAVLYIDLDHFKEINDRLGHAAGDSLLVETAHRLIAAVRESDTVARLGGDEFAIVLSEVHTLAEAEEVAQRIVLSLARPFELKEGMGRISGSIGVALFPEHGNDAETLQRHADMALYAVKEAGRNGYRLYSPLMTAR
jgi:diguanylate cyclase (GGDEF)-like protein/PAS domain S-box-containing protein